MTPIKYRTRPTTERIILHDSHSLPIVNGVDYLLVNGRTRGYLSVGYNFVIERNGECHETRNHAAVGSHTPGHNHNSVGVCLVGGRELDMEDYGSMNLPVLLDSDNFTMDQLQALRKLVRNLRQLYGPDVPLVGHSELHKFHDGTRCPCLDMREVRASMTRGD